MDFFETLSAEPHDQDMYSCKESSQSVKAFPRYQLHNFTKKMWRRILSKLRKSLRLISWHLQKGLGDKLFYQMWHFNRDRGHPKKIVFHSKQQKMSYAQIKYFRSNRKHLNRTIISFYQWYLSPMGGQIFRFVFSRVHATLYVTMSVRWSVGPSVRRSVRPKSLRSAFWCFELKGC